MSELWKHALEYAENQNLTCEQFSKRPLVDDCIAIDPEKDDEYDAEQVFKIEWLDSQKRVARVTVSIIDPTNIPVNSPIEESAAQVTESTFGSDNRHTQLMMPETITFNTHSFIEKQVRPSLTVQYDVDINERLVTNQQWFLSQTINSRQFSVEEVDALVGDADMQNITKDDYLLVANTLFLIDKEPYKLQNFRQKDRYSDGKHITQQLISLANESVALLCTKAQREAADKNEPIPVFLFSNYLTKQQINSLRPNNEIAIFTQMQEDGSEIPIYSTNPEENAEMIIKQKNENIEWDALPPNLKTVSTKNYGNKAGTRVKISTPIREYQSLINIRSIIAYLKQEPLPYTHSKVWEKLVRINSISWERQIEGKLKTEVHHNLKKLIPLVEASGNYQLLEGHDTLSVYEAHEQISKATEELSKFTLEYYGVSDPLKITPKYIEKRYRALCKFANEFGKQIPPQDESESNLEFLQRIHQNTKDLS